MQTHSRRRREEFKSLLSRLIQQARSGGDVELAQEAVIEEYERLIAGRNAAEARLNDLNRQLRNLRSIGR